jgi:ribose/xylose/arabinose/galactoside ABC-type transport system permease subunit
MRKEACPVNLRTYIPTLLDNLIWVLLLAVIIFFSIFAGGFLDTGSFINILVHAAVLGLLVVGESFTLITGNFDLSVESTLGFCAMLSAWLVLPMGPPENGSGLMMNPLLAIAIILVLGPVIGWINGTLITRGKMNNFVVTLSMLIALRGLMLLVPQGNTIYRTPPLYNILGATKVGPIPLPVIVVLLAFAIGYVVLKYTPFGRDLYAVGGNRDAALASGVDPDKRIRQVYIIAGFLAALAGWMLAGRLRSVIPNLGEGMVFEVMAAAVIGGISLQGGRGTMLGAFGGVLLLSTIGTGLNLMDVSEFWIGTVRGVIILAAMLIDAQKVRYAAPAATAEPKVPKVVLAGD